MLTTTPISAEAPAIATPLSYRDVLHTRERVGSMQRMCEFASALGYPFYLWNDRVYRTAANGPSDTGLLVADVQ